MKIFDNKLNSLRQQALKEAQQQFAIIDEIAANNTVRVLDAFRHHRISEYHFRTTSGYAYNDAGREKLEAVWADICETEKALVRTQFVSGTHALASVLFGILRPGDELLAVTGTPYDTMQSVIGYDVSSRGSLKEFGISYTEVPMVHGKVDISSVIAQLKSNTKIVLIQRSRGYSLRSPLTIEEIQEIISEVKRKKPECICFVDNCYGEFVDLREPSAIGADIIAGSLIKNPGGGIAPTGGYVAGKADLVDLVSYRLTAPGIGSELGASLVENRLLFQGLFMAPHTTAQAVKGAIFAASLFSLLGFHTIPCVQERRSDIIQAIELGSPEKMIAFCRGLQKYSPVDSYVLPEPSAMPGYSDKVIMAGGTFIQGASIELSADGPIRPPYTVYLQGGLTFEHAAIGIMGAAAEVLAI